MIRGHRAGGQPHAPRRPTGGGALLGPSLPDAACQGTPERIGALVYGPLWDWSVHGEITGERAQRLGRATAVCRDCPEISRCLQARINHPELGAGVWGGQLFAESRRSTCRCGTPIPTGTGKKKLYCSGRCRDQAKGTKNRKPQRVMLCRCGTRFSTAQPRQQFCTKKCRRRAERRARRVERRPAA